MFEIPNPQDTGYTADDEVEPVISIVAMMAGLLIVIALILAIGFGATYFLGGLGIGFAVFLPVWQSDHGADERRRWIGRNDGPHAVEVWMLRACWVGIVCVFIGGLVFGGVA